MNPERIILTPGPVAVPGFVWEAMQQPLLHQRSPAFKAFFAQVQDDLRYLFQTVHPVLVLNGSGTLGVEMTLRSLFGSGDRVLVMDFGKFSGRWAAWADWNGLDSVHLRHAWGEIPDADALRALLAESPPLHGAVLTHVETSTGAGCDLETLAGMIRAHSPHCLLVADCISTVGAQAVYADAWDLDAVVTASQKGLMSPVGAAFVSLSPRAQAALQPGFEDDFFHLRTYLGALQAGSYPFTPPTQLLYGVGAALRAIRAQGLPARWMQVHSLARHFRSAAAGLGLTVRPAGTADAVTVLELPGGDADAVRKRLLDGHGVEIAGGQGPMKGKVMRVGHFGAVGAAEHAALVGGLEAVLRTAGSPA